MKKKGQNAIIDGIFFIIIIIVFGIVALLGYQSFSEIKDDIRDDVTLNESKDAITEVESRYPSLFDGLILIVFMGMWLAGIATAMMSESHPFVFGLTMVLIVFVIIAGVMLGNFYEELFEDEDLNTMPTTFPVTNWLLTHMLQLGIVVVLTIALVLFGKNAF